MSAPGIQVELRHHRTQRLLGTVELADLKALHRLGTPGQATLFVGGRVQTFRVHGYEWDTVDGAVVGTLWVAV